MTTEIVVRTETRSESEIDLGEAKMNPFVEDAARSSRKGSRALSELYLATYNF